MPPVVKQTSEFEKLYLGLKSLSSFEDKKQHVIDNYETYTLVWESTAKALGIDQKTFNTLKNVRSTKFGNSAYMEVEVLVGYSEDLEALQSAEIEEELIKRYIVPDKYNSLCYLRQSVDKGFTLKQDLAGLTTEKLALSLGFTPYTIRETKSGYNTPVLQILKKNPHIKAIFVEEVNRLARNVKQAILILEYCHQNRIKIYCGNTLITGLNVLTYLIMSTMAEFDLVDKQRSYANYLVHIIEFKLGIIEWNQIPKEALKLANLSVYITDDDFYKKAFALSTKRLKKYPNDVNAQRILELLTE